MLDIIFDMCVTMLYDLADLFGMTYKQINVVIFCLILPLIIVFLYISMNFYKNKLREAQNSSKKPAKINQFLRIIVILGCFLVILQLMAGAFFVKIWSSMRLSGKDVFESFLISPVPDDVKILWGDGMAWLDNGGEVCFEADQNLINEMSKKFSDNQKCCASAHSDECKEFPVSNIMKCLNVDIAQNHSAGIECYTKRKRVLIYNQEIKRAFFFFK